MIRFSAPTINNKAPHNTICYVIINETQEDIYIQKSNDENNPEWEYLRSIHDVFGMSYDSNS